MDQYIKNERCIENYFAAQRELAAIEEARGFRETEKLRAQLSASEQRVKALEDTLLLVQVLLIHISARGHKSGYNWNSDPEKLTLTEGEIHERINKALEATCTNTPKG